MNYFNESGNYESEIKKSYDKTNMSTDSQYMGATAGVEATMYGGTCGAPLYECPQERVCHRYICHEVPHIMPCNTRIINHHIFRHTFTPEYTCCEENVCENVYEPRCC